MKRITVFLLLLLMCSAVAFAHPLRWYAGGSLQANAVIEQWNESRWDDTPHTGPDYFGTGLQIEGGLAGNFWNGYLGFRQDICGMRDWRSNYHENNRWLGERFLLGARLHVSDEFPNPVKPLLGAGVTYGWAQHRLESQSGMMAGEVVQESSRGAFGWLAEAGFLVKVQDQWLLSFMLQAERLNVQLGDQSQYGTVKDAYQAAARVGVQYQFSRGL